MAVSLVILLGNEVRTHMAHHPLCNQTVVLQSEAGHAHCTIAIAFKIDLGILEVALRLGFLFPLPYFRLLPSCQDFVKVEAFRRAVFHIIKKRL